MPDLCQVLVVGGGPAGASVAIALARAGISVRLITGDGCRSSLAGEALAPKVGAELAGLGLAGQYPSTVAIPSYGIEAAWGRPGPLFHSYVVDPLGNGWHVDRSAWHELLLKTAEQGGASLLRGARFLGARKEGTRWTVTVQCGSRTADVGCHFLVDATGRPALVARSLGAQRRRMDNLCGISAVFETSSPARNLVVEATPHGWWYLAPLPGSCTLVCFVSDTDIIRRLGLFRANQWHAFVRQASFVSSRLGDLREPFRLRAHPCETSTLNRATGDGWIAIGDAASVFDPVSSMGVLKALRSGRGAAMTIEEFLRGDPAALVRYSELHFNGFGNYLAQRRRHYAAEGRWSRETFWSRRN